MTVPMFTVPATMFPFPAHMHSLGHHEFATCLMGGNGSFHETATCLMRALEATGFFTKEEPREWPEFALWVHYPPFPGIPFLIRGSRGSGAWAGGGGTQSGGGGGQARTDRKQFIEADQ